MAKPNITMFDALTGETIVREMTDEEYAALIESGWTETGSQESAPSEEPSDDAG